MRKEYYELHKKRINEGRKEYYKKNREKLIKAAKEYRLKYPEKVKRSKELTKDRDLDYMYRKIYGISLAEYNEMLDKQNYVCFICKNDNGDKKLGVDHCHKTGKVRGLLCRNCNLGLGYFKDDKQLLFKVIEYLEL